MEITSVPFFNKVGIGKTDEGTLTLPIDDSVLNHLNTLNASALFTLAEPASGEALQNRFPELAGKVIPVLRDSQIKFRKPATTDVMAFPSMSIESLERFNEQLTKKGRGLIEVEVEVRDRENTTICLASFNWFVQRIEA